MALWGEKCTRVIDTMLVVGLAGWLCWGCSVPVAAGLDERDANLVADALNRAGISAIKQTDPNAEERYEVRVAQSNAAGAIGVLRDHDLPPRKIPTVEDIHKGTLVPSALVEQAQFTAVLAGDLERSLSSIDGVLGARVHLSIPQKTPKIFGAKETAPSASVLVRHKKDSFSLNPNDVKGLISGAVSELTPENVTVMFVAQPVSILSAASLTHWGPFEIDEKNLGVARFVAAGLCTLLMILGTLILWLLRRVTVLKRAISHESVQQMDSATIPKVRT